MASARPASGYRARLGRLPFHHRTGPDQPKPGAKAAFYFVSKEQCKCGWPAKYGNNFRIVTTRRSKDGEVLESDEDCWRRLYDQCIRHFDDDNEHNLEKPLFALKQPPSLTQLCAAVDAPAERLLARLSLPQASPAHIVDVSRTIKLCRDVVRVGAPTLERKRRKESGAGCVGGWRERRRRRRRRRHYRWQWWQRRRQRQNFRPSSKAA